MHLGVAAHHAVAPGGRFSSDTQAKLKVTGIDLFSAGDFIGNDQTEEIVMHDAVGGVYKKLVIRDDRIVGGIMVGDIAVFRNAEDEVFALADKCPHKGGPLSQGIVHGRKVTCPLHNWNIQLQDGCAVAPDVGCARRYPVRVEAAVVFLQISPA